MAHMPLYICDYATFNLDSENSRRLPAIEGAEEMT